MPNRHLCVPAPRTRVTGTTGIGCSQDPQGNSASNHACGYADPVSHAERVISGCAVACLLFAASAARADYIVPAGGITSLNAGTLNLACTDLIVGGTFNVNSGAIRNARNITIQSGGVLNGGSGSIAVSGNWSVSPTGQFSPGTSDVRFDESCGPGLSTISGSTTFHDVHFTSATGKSFVFTVGTTQTIAGLFEFQGTASAPAQFLSSIASQVAYINLQPGGTQLISHVGVTDVWATGQHLAPNQTNEGGSGNANGWFGSPGAAAVIPTLGNAALMALAALLAGIGGSALDARARRRKSGRRNCLGGESRGH